MLCSDLCGKYQNKPFSQSIRVLSFALMCMVVYIHAQIYYPSLLDNNPDINKPVLRFLQMFISSEMFAISVPLFYFISGLFFVKGIDESKQWYIKKVKSRTLSLLIPYFFWSCLYFVIIFIAQSFSITRGYFDSAIREMNFTEILTRLFWTPYCSQLWYIRDLYIFVIFFPIIYIFIRYIPKLFLALLLVVWFFNFDTRISFISQGGLFFFSLGCFYKLKGAGFDISEKKALAFVFFWLLLVLIRSITYINFSKDLVWIHNLSILFGCIAIWNLKDYLAKLPEIIKKISAYTFFLYVFHYPLIVFLNKFYLKFSNNNEPLRILIYLINPIFVILFCVFSGMTLKKYFPKTYNFVTGGR